jgi:hypothetical protein
MRPNRRTLDAMKFIPATIVALLLLATFPARAASDADVTLIKVKSVRIEEGVITIVAEAKTQVMLIQGDPNPAHKGPSWKGRPVTVSSIKSDLGTFVIKREHRDILSEAWQMSLQAAKDLQDGKEVGRIGYYGPDMTIKGNLIESITGFGFLYPKGK